MSIAPTHGGTAAVAPIERVTIPLRPRTPAGCCDLAVLFYGRNVRGALRLWLAVAIPALALVYGFGRFVGTNLSLAILTAILVSKQLGAMTVAAAVRSTFGESFERPRDDERERRTPIGRLRELTRSMMTAAAVLAAAALIASIVDDAYGAGRLAALGTESAAAAVAVVSAVIAARAQLFLAEYHAPTVPVRNGILRGTLFRAVVAAPLTLLLFEATQGWGIVVAVLWLPIAALIATRRSFESERRALAEISPSLHSRQSGAVYAFGDMAGTALTVSAATAGLAFVVFAGLEAAFRLIDLPSPITGPLGDSLDSQFFDLGPALVAIGRSPLFCATALASWLFAYQLGRVAWYFAYLDARVRRDCWDMELMLTREAKRLEGE